MYNIIVSTLSLFTCILIFVLHVLDILLKLRKLFKEFKCKDSKYEYTKIKRISRTSVKKRDVMIEYSNRSENNVFSVPTLDVPPKRSFAAKVKGARLQRRIT